MANMVKIVIHYLCVLGPVLSLENYFIPKIIYLEGESTGPK